MSEQATRIANQATGDRIATRDAYETDVNGNARTLQIVGFSSRQIVVHPPLRGYPTPVTVVDTADLTNLPVELTTNIIDIGDTNILVVDVEHTASDGSATITPLIFNENETTVLAVRASKTSGMGSVVFRRGAASGNYVSPQLQWDTLGASKIGLHISVIGGTANGVILKGGALSPRTEVTTTSTTTSSSSTTTTSTTSTSTTTTSTSSTCSTSSTASTTSSSSSTASTTSSSSSSTSSTTTTTA